MLFWTALGPPARRPGHSASLGLLREGRAAPCARCQTQELPTPGPQLPPQDPPARRSRRGVKLGARAGRAPRGAGPGQEAAASKASPGGGSSATLPAPARTGVSAAPARAQQRMRCCRAQGPAGAQQSQEGPSPPRCCGAGRALVTAAWPRQQQPEEQKPQTQELFWGRKRASALPRPSARPQRRAGPNGSQEATEATGCRDGEATEATCCPGSSPAQQSGHSDPRDPGACPPPLAPAPGPGSPLPAALSTILAEPPPPAVPVLPAAPPRCCCLGRTPCPPRCFPH